MYKVANPGIIVSLLKQGLKPILLLGAGASKQSGIKLVTEIVEELAKWAYCREHGVSLEDPRLTMSDWKTWVSKFPWYNQDYNTLYPKIVEELLHPRAARRDFFIKIITPNVEPSKGYEVVAELMSLGLLDTVLTTNFDNCLHEAKVKIRKPSVLHSIKTPVDLKNLFSISPREAQLVYLHGAVEHYTDQNLLEEVQHLNADLKNNITPFLKDRPLVVIGYRGAEPSIMNDLFLQNLDFTNNFQQGIYWCLLKREYERIESEPDILTPFFKQLAQAAKGNFHIIPIDGFDELMVKEVQGKLKADEIDLRNTYSASSFSPTNRTTFDTQIIAQNTIGALEIALIRERVINYSRRLNIKIYDDQDWLYQQMIRLKIADAVNPDKYELTAAGILLFSSSTQQVLPNARTLLRFKGNAEWLRQITSFASDSENNIEDYSSGVIERTINGNLWNQLNEITDSLTLINKPFRLKGETSENIYPYPTLALKEIIVNSLVHRDYSMNESIVIEITPTHITFKSPGGLVEEVKRQLISSSMEDEIRKGKRGIKGYRHPVLADLFYGSGAMDKEGSGLSDVLKQVTDNSGMVSFGPTNDENHFEVKIFRRIEDIDQQTQTANPLIINQSSKFACNLFEILELPERIYFGDTEARWWRDINEIIGDAWRPPYSLFSEKIWSFYDLSNRYNPLSMCVDLGTVESITLDEFINLTGDTKDLVKLLNESFAEHLFSIGLRVDTKKKRAYFTCASEGQPKEITYQGRLKKATRTVAKPKINKSSGIIYYWEHKSIWYSFENLGNQWYLMINPSYVFTTDGIKRLLRSERVNVLSNKKASRDYNMAVHNDLTFWSKYISQNEEGVFSLRPNSRDLNDATIKKLTIPDIIISSKLPTVVINDISVSENFVEPTELDDLEDVERQLEEIAKEEQG